MDPIETILRILSARGTPRRILMADLIEWFAKGGFKPTIAEVSREYAKRHNGRWPVKSLRDKMKALGLPQDRAPVNFPRYPDASDCKPAPLPLQALRNATARMIASGSPVITERTPHDAALEQARDALKAMLATALACDDTAWADAITRAGTNRPCDMAKAALDALKV